MINRAMDYVDKRKATDKSKDSFNSELASILRLIHRLEMLGIAYQQNPPPLLLDFQ